MKTAPITLDMVEHLLKIRPSTREEEDWSEIEQIALALVGEADPEGVRKAKQCIKENELNRESVVALADMNTDKELEKYYSEILEENKKSDVPANLPLKAQWKRVALSLAAMIVICLTALIFVDSFLDHKEVEEELVVKGSADTLLIAVERGTERFVASPKQTLEDGDNLGLFYSASNSGFLAVLSLDAKGETSLLFPVEGSESGSIAAGQRAPLPDGAIVRAGTGCEWLVAVFSKEPLSVEDIAKELRSGTRTEKDCKLDVDIAGARTVSIFSVRR